MGARCSSLDGHLPTKELLARPNSSCSQDADARSAVGSEVSGMSNVSTSSMQKLASAARLGGAAARRGTAAERRERARLAMEEKAKEQRIRP